MAWDWQVFLQGNNDRLVIAGCFGKGGDQTYLNWIISAWGWTLTVALGGTGGRASGRPGDRDASNPA
jgi:hypothetical protein